ncbi:MAG TPA: phosphatidate cytidylyltransferase [Actinomycetes bacterium]|nr:phosphatidate cytidylyltransferase [Actinomycetes bacterium]
MTSLYALKPRFSVGLTGVRRHCVDSRVRPATLTWLGVAFGAAAGLALAALPHGPLAGVTVGALLVARLACANLDGGVARESGTSTRWGSVQNELGDRLADLAMLAGVVWLVGAPLGGLLLVAASAPSWATLAINAAGGMRPNGGPMGKTERCALVVLAAATGWVVPAAVVIVAGSLATAGLRLRQGHVTLAGAR